MKKLTDILLIILFCIIAGAITAQDLYIQGGYNLTGMGRIFPDDHLDGTTSMKPGFHLGLLLEIPIAKQFSIVTSAQLTTKGWIYQYSENYSYYSSSQESYREESSLLFIDLPFTFQYKVPLDWKTSLYFMGGPYLGIGIYGETKYTYTYTDNYSYGTNGYNEHSGTDKMTDPLERIDIGHTIGVGIQEKDFRFGISYDMGISPLVTNNTAGSTAVRFTVGYKLN